MKNTFGTNISLTIFGESHGAGIGAVLDGIAAGVPLDLEALDLAMEKRRARGDGLSTGRMEPDRVKFLSGVVEGRTTGTPIAILIENTNTRSGDYKKTQDLLRPGHADYTAWAKYEGWQDARGGGHFSGRITAAAVAAGEICRQILEGMGITLSSHIAQVAGLEDAPLSGKESLLKSQLEALNRGSGFALVDPDRAPAMMEAIREESRQGDSVGGILETAAVGLPAGVGEPFFDSMESVLAHLAFSIPAVKGIEFGAGFALADMTGSQANDPFAWAEERLVTTTNHNGGVNGGIANGMPLVFRTVVKPTPSIYKPQQTVDYPHHTTATLQIQGRHDPCILARAAVVQTAMTAFGLLDMITARYGTLCHTHGLPGREKPWNTD